jgi:outer membrane protein OmpA-like peptidoglycan-associated protein
VRYTNVQQVVGFEPNQAVLTAAGAAQLDQIATQVPAGTLVDVIGYVWEGTPGDTFTMDAQRAQTVAAYLTARGVQVGQVIAGGKQQRGVVIGWTQKVTS